MIQYHSWIITIFFGLLIFAFGFWRYREECMSYTGRKFDLIKFIFMPNIKDDLYELPYQIIGWYGLAFFVIGACGLYAQYS